MSGKRGRLRSEPDMASGRARIWRIMRRRLAFTVDELVIPLEGVTVTNALKYIQNLTRHGFIRFDRWSGKAGRPGSRKVFRLVRNTGPVPPTQCPTCGRSVTARSCEVVAENAGGES